MQGLVTIFGGSGFIGRNVVRVLAAEGWRIRVATRNPHLTGDLRPMGDVGQIAVVGANVRDDKSVARALDGATACVNLVGILNESGRQRFAAVQAEGARRVAQAAAREGVTRFVQFSAIGADPRSKSAYARSKAEGEQAVREAIPTAVVLRPSIVFGSGDDFFNRFASMATIAPALPLIGGGRTRFRPVYVADVAKAVGAVLREPEAAGRTFELAGPTTYSFRELLEAVMRETGHNRFLAPLPFEIAGPLGSAFALAARFLPITPPITGDQVELLKRDNVPAEGAPGLEALGISPTPLEVVLPTYVWRYRKGGQFSDARGAGLKASTRST